MRNLSHSFALDFNGNSMVCVCVVSSVRCTRNISRTQKISWSLVKALAVRAHTFRSHFHPCWVEKKWLIAWTQHTFTVTVDVRTYILKTPTPVILASCDFLGFSIFFPRFFLFFFGVSISCAFIYANLAEYMLHLFDTHFPIVFISECRWVLGVLCHYFRI